MITTIKEFINERKLYYLKALNIKEKNIPIELIEHVIEHYESNDCLIDLSKVPSNILLDLKNDTINYLKSENINYIYRYIRGDFKIGDTIKKHRKNLESWSFDEETALSFSNDKDNGVLIKENIENIEDYIIFSIDIFIESIPEKIIEDIHPIYQRIINQYVSESEILCYHKDIVLTNDNCEIKKYRQSTLNVTESYNFKETMTFWHGGNLDDYNDDLAHKSGHWEFGAGLYLTTSYNVVQKYAKGSRKLYQVTVEKGVDLNYNYLPLNIFYDFVNKNVIGSKRKEVLDSINRLQKNGELNAEIFLNIIISNKAITNNKTNILKQFFVNNGIDYNIVDNAFGWGEKMMILFNSKKIVNIKRITSKDIIEEYDLPTKFSNTNI